MINQTVYGSFRTEASAALWLQDKTLNWNNYKKRNNFTMGRPGRAYVQEARQLGTVLHWASHLLCRNTCFKYVKSRRFMKHYMLLAAARSMPTLGNLRVAMGIGGLLS